MMRERNKTSIIKTFLFVFLLMGLCNNSNATGIPRPIGGENRIKIINYMPNTVYKFVGHYEFQSIIEFGIDEEIDTISMGTPTPWQIVPAGNRIFLKPVENEATTNMTVITNKRMYFFEMHAEEAAGVNDERLNFVVKFIYPEQYEIMNSIAANSGATGSIAPKLDEASEENYNFNYTIAGEASYIEPLQVFDDGEFTFFKFKDINAELPAIFQVDSQGNEGVVNYRIEKGYVIVERVSDRFTLRHGPDVICVFNENGKNAAKNKKNFFFF